MTSIYDENRSNYSISSRSSRQPRVAFESPGLSGERAVSESPSLSTDSTISSDTPVALKAIRPLFNRVYKPWSRSEQVDEEDMHNLRQCYVTVDDFLRLTQNRRLQKYIALIDNRIRFDEIPLSPYGEIIFYMTDFLSRQLQTMQPGNILYGMSDNGVVSAILC